MRWLVLIVGLLAILAPCHAASGAIEIALAPAADNPANPRMGDRLSFHGVITNNGTEPVTGVLVWLTLVETDPENPQPVDLEDWSDRRAVTQAVLEPGQTLAADWSLRLIQAGRYTVIVQALDGSAGGLAASLPVAFTVAPKPVVESARVLPAAFGAPLFIIALIGLRHFTRFGRKPA
jgi:hypothetical protein